MEPADALRTAFAMSLTNPSYLVVTCRRAAGLEEAVPEPLTFDEPLVCSEFMRARPGIAPDEKTPAHQSLLTDVFGSGPLLCTIYQCKNFEGRRCKSVTLQGRLLPSMGDVPGCL